MNRILSRGPFRVHASVAKTTWCLAARAAGPLACILLAIVGCSGSPGATGDAALSPATPAAKGGESPRSTAGERANAAEASAAPDALRAANREQADGKLPAAPETMQLGMRLYGQHCAACHGTQGDGMGVAAAYLFPKPRDFRAGRFRIVSTANNVPTREDLHSVLMRGMPGSSMPPWRHLPQAERAALVDEVIRLRGEGVRAQYIQTLKEQDELTDEEIAAEDVQEEIQQAVEERTRPGERSHVPAIGEPSPGSLARAIKVYAEFGCLQCHGADGKGDGVQKMVDDDGYPITARDFTAGIFKGGHDPASLYRRIAYGMPGTPMPSQKLITPEQIIDLVHYIRSMSSEPQRLAAELNRERMIAKRVAALPSDTSLDQWHEVPAANIRMTPLWWRNNADPEFKVWALHDGRSIAIRLSWRDTTPDRHAMRSESFEDGVAVEFYRGNAEPFVGMGDPRAAIDVWYWDGDRQSLAEIDDEYPDMVVDIYPFSEHRVDTPEYRREGTKRSQQPEVSLPAEAVGNPIASPHAASSVSNLTAAGPGTVTFLRSRSPYVAGRGAWADGRWTVVLTRELAIAEPDRGLSLAPGDKLSVAFAVWDGAQDDRDGKKLITVWQDLELER